jgi:hypothetical protein
MDLLVWSGEATSRTYQINYKNDLGLQLRNKKKGLAKGLKSTNWKLGVSKAGSVYSEVRAINLFVDELKRYS